MRCPHCGQTLAQESPACPRCQADLTPAARGRELAVSLVVAVVAIAVVTALIFVVLNWHDAQMLGT